jgi:hypothetical protein
MHSTIFPDRSYETTKLLRRSKGIFSKTRRTLTSPPQFRIEHLSGPEGLSTAALLERYDCRRTIDYDTAGTVTPAHNWKTRKPDIAITILCDWKPSPLLSKGKLSCKRNEDEKRFLPGSVDSACPIHRYISDRRPRGISPQQLDFAVYCFAIRSELSLFCILNGPMGHRTDSEDSLKSPGRNCRIRFDKVHKTVFGKDAMIPYICLERRSLSTEKVL